MLKEDVEQLQQKWLKQKEKEKSRRWNKVDAVPVREVTGSRDMVKHVEKSDQLFVEKMM